MENTNKIDVEKIMQEIREDIKEKGYTNEMLSFHEVQVQTEGVNTFNKNEYKHILHNINMNCNVPWYRDIAQGGVIGFIKKVVRKMCAFLIAPISDQQNLFNGEVTKEFNQITGYMDEIEEQFELYKKNIELLEEKISKLETEMEVLRKEK